MAHRHWPKGLTERLGIDYSKVPVCLLPKTECDALWSAYQHGHEGVPCRKQVLPGNVKATCILEYTDEELASRLGRRIKRESA